MNYLFNLADVALKSIVKKTFTLEDGHSMTISPSGDGKTMKIDIDDVESYKTRGSNNFVSQIVKILKNRGVAWWDETKEGQDNVYNVLSMYEQFEDVHQEKLLNMPGNKCSINSN
jgi:hypothetical protein